jgi:hypothetical protein
MINLPNSAPWKSKKYPILPIKTVIFTKKHATLRKMQF